MDFPDLVTCFWSSKSLGGREPQPGGFFTFHFTVFALRGSITPSTLSKLAHQCNGKGSTFSTWWMGGGALGRPWCGESVTVGFNIPSQAPTIKLPKPCPLAFDFLPPPHNDFDPLFQHARVRCWHFWTATEGSHWLMEWGRVALLGLEWWGENHREGRVLSQRDWQASVQKGWKWIAFIKRDREKKVCRPQAYCYLRHLITHVITHRNNGSENSVELYEINTWAPNQPLYFNLPSRGGPIIHHILAGANQPVHWFLEGKGLGI